MDLNNPGELHTYFSLLRTTSGHYEKGCRGPVKDHVLKDPTVMKICQSFFSPNIAVTQEQFVLMSFITLHGSVEILYLYYNERRDVR